MQKTVARPALRLRLLGRLIVSRNGVAVELPTSRKVRALLAYLAMSPRPLSREHLCEMLGDTANDPRGDLRWCLSRARALLDDGERRRLVSDGEAVGIDLCDGEVDAQAVERAIDAGIGTLDATRLQALADAFAGEFVEALHLDRSPLLDHWMDAQRRRFRGFRVAILERLVERLAARGDADGAALETWLQLAPFDLRAHGRLLQSFASQRQIGDAERHLATTERAFEAEGLDPRPLRAAWTRALADVASAIGSSASAATAAPPAADERGDSVPARRASIAIMPFVEWPPSDEPRGGLADGLAHDIITRLAKLRSLFVIAPGSIFALRERRVEPAQAARMLNVDYLVSGAVRRSGERIVVHCELSATRTAQIVWADVFEQTLDDALLVLDELGSRIVSLLAGEIELLERNRAVLLPPNSLDAWQAHHRGLWHMYRFDREHNQRARHYFEIALRLDPHYSRAHAGLSFTHFQDAFQHWTPREQAVASAAGSAERSLRCDERDPAAHWSMGRALWLRGERDPALKELRAAVELSPNFALGHYTLAFVHSQSGDAGAALEASDHARQLSPFDPLLFGMLGARAMALVRMGRFGEAADWALKAADRPNAHAHIQAIAAFSLTLAGRVDEARRYADRARAAAAGYRVDDFLSSFSFPADTQAAYRRAASAVGLV